MECGGNGEKTEKSTVLYFMEGFVIHPHPPISFQIETLKQTLLQRKDKKKLLSFAFIDLGEHLLNLTLKFLTTKSPE